MTLETDGTLHDFLGHLIEDEDLTDGLKKAHPGDSNKVRHVKLHIENEEKTSIAKLGKALERIKKAADRKKETIVFVLLRSIPKEKQ